MGSESSQISFRIESFSLDSLRKLAASKAPIAPLHVESAFKIIYFQKKNIETIVFKFVEEKKKIILILEKSKHHKRSDADLQPEIKEKIKGFTKSYSKKK